MRKLVSIRKIKEILPLPTSDFLEIAVIDGWKVVIRKDEHFKVDDRVVYFEVDCFLPPREPFLGYFSKFPKMENGTWVKVISSDPKEKLNAINYCIAHWNEYLASKIDDGSWLRVHADGDFGFRILSLTLRGQLSQGIVFPVSSCVKQIPNIDDLPIGTDITSDLGVKIWSEPIPSVLNGVAIGMLPALIKGTDQERIQNLFDEYLLRYKGMKCQIEEKLDGTSFTAYYLLESDYFGIAGHSVEWKDDELNIYWRLARKYDLRNVLKRFGKSIALQGELVGEDIEDNRLGLKDQDIYFFDIYDIDGRHYYLPFQRQQFFDTAGRSLKQVPIIERECQIFSRFKNVDDMVASSNGMSIINPKRRREGLVVKSCELVDNSVISFKIKSNNYLLKVEK